MKKTLLTLALVAVTAASFGQGKISMLNDATRLVTWSNVVKNADSGLVGSPVLNSGTGATLLVDLYGGLTAGTMVLQTTTTISAAPGLFGPINFLSTGVPGGTVGTFQVQVRESSFATAAAAFAGQGYYGFSPIFTFKPSSTIAFNSIINAGGTALSTWGAGPILVTANVPEPTSMALAGIGAAAMVIFRRRK